MSRWIVAIVLFAVAPTFAADARTWEGTWNNKKYGTSGPLKCVATPGEDGRWKATFSGTFKKDPFSYDVTFESEPKGRQTALGGTATISGHRYQWQGKLQGKTLFGEYRSKNGYFGSFSLKEK